LTASYPSLGVPTTWANTVVATVPCDASRDWGETFTLNPNEPAGVVMQCRVRWTEVVPRTPFKDGTWSSTAKWYLHDPINGGWWENIAPGVWVFAGKEHP
jgi:hypothetical protein